MRPKNVWIRNNNWNFIWKWWRKKIFSEIRTIKEEFTQANVELSKIPDCLSELDSILNKISTELQSYLYNNKSGDKTQKCNKASTKLTSCKDALFKIDFKELQKINLIFDEARNEILSKINNYEKLCKESFSTRAINNARLNCTDNKTPQKNSSNNCL